MRASAHVVVSAGVSLAFQSQVHCWPATAACFLGGILIDIDHYLEYYIIKKKFPFRYKDLTDFCDYDDCAKVYLLLHAYEFLLIFWLMIGLLHLNLIYVGLALGVTVHMIFDQFTNPIKPLFYFLTYRISKGFKKTDILSPSYFENRDTLTFC